MKTQRRKTSNYRRPPRRFVEIQDQGTKILPRSQAAFIREAVGEIRLMATKELTIAGELLKMAEELEGELLRLSCADLEQSSLC